MAEYIEREALKRAFQDIDAGRSDGWTTSLSPEEAADYLAEYLDDIPAADVAPEKHGHWRQVDENKCECSNCGIIVLIAVYPHGDKNYCPNCGAKMDKGSEENNNG